MYYSSKDSYHDSAGKFSIFHKSIERLELPYLFSLQIWALLDRFKKSMPWPRLFLGSIVLNNEILWVIYWLNVKMFPVSKSLLDHQTRRTNRTLKDETHISLGPTMLVSWIDHLLHSSSAGLEMHSILLSHCLPISLLVLGSLSLASSQLHLQHVDKSSHPSSLLHRLS